MNLTDKVEQAIRRGELLRPGTRVGCACSGGADSVALVRLLYDLKDRLGLRLLVAHLNHQLRGSDSDADEAFVRRLAERLELEFVVRREDVAARAEKGKINLEEAGREARLEFFASLITGGKVDAVAVAHTLDDQAETVLARLVRGAGTRGLAGIYPVIEPLPGAKKGRLIRPLLSVRRAELREYLDSLQQPWREDATNRDPARLRSRIRVEFLPGLNPAALEHIGRLAGHAREEESFWSALIEDRFKSLAHRTGNELELPVAGLVEPDPLLAKLPPRQAREGQRALARRLLRRAIAEVRGDLRRITQTHVEKVLALVTEGQSGNRLVLPGVEVERRFELVVICAASERAATAPYELSVDAPQTVRLPDGSALEVKLVAVAQLEPGYNGARDAADAARAQFPLLVRNWRPGDRFAAASGGRSTGSGGRKKLKTLFQQHRIPLGQRAGLPVVISGGEIIWARRLGVAAGYALTEASRTALVIEEKGE
ncbi:MAG: tRNA lysidine(34) synthetase TilS [Acidobacteria bacterium]|nr:tRNA lysidine(34) synthetase TilS [Acidobacteriota bacterium]